MKKKFGPYPFVLLLIFNLCACNSPEKHSLADTEIKVPPVTQISSEDQNKAPKPEIKNCLCPELWLPVCGENGKTYSNTCFAQCAGVKFKQGSCAKIITD